MKVGDCAISLVRGDITQTEAGALVNAANGQMITGSGVDGAINRAGGPAIEAERKKIRESGRQFSAGDVVATTAGDLQANHVIHAVGPIWQGGGLGEEAALGRVYRGALELAVRLGHRSVAFPSISTGVYGYPVEKAAAVAARTIVDFLKEMSGNLDAVTMVLFSDADLAAYRTAFEKAI
jgi:O-acetyl-ADP-ribose deacetylase (regulator of RNase III)